MAASELAPLQPSASQSQWYVIDLSLSLKLPNHNSAIIPVLVFSFALLFTLLLYHFIRQYRDLSAESWRSQVVRGIGLPVPAVPSDRNKGLDAAAINGLPTFFHGAEGGRGGAAGVEEMMSECSICLGMFEENDKVKAIPKCMHVYHSECLDKWLQIHGNCPLCRSTVDDFRTQLSPA